MEDEIGPIRDCVGCGFCCWKTKCAAGQRLYRSATICPALKWNGTRHVCDLMELPGNLGHIYRQELYAGEGCCSNLNSWRVEPLQDRTLFEYEKPYVNPIPPIMQKFLKALGSEWVSGDVLSLTVSGFQSELTKEGMSDEESAKVGLRVLRYLADSRSKKTKEFMG